MQVLEIKKIKRSYCIVAGKSVLGKFATFDRAESSLHDEHELYKYWAGSAGVSIENTPPCKVVIG